MLEIPCGVLNQTCQLSVSILDPNTGRVDLSCIRFISSICSFFCKFVMSEINDNNNWIINDNSINNICIIS